MINISPHLLWEYDKSTLDIDKSRVIVIERVVERGNIKDWQEIISYYPKEEILRVIEHSKQLSKKDKHFAELFIDAAMRYAA